jgi:hypothetical protein
MTIFETFRSVTASKKQTNAQTTQTNRKIKIEEK